MNFILNKALEVIGVLKNSEGVVESASSFFEDLHTEDLTTGAETYQFTTTGENDNAKKLLVGNYVAFKKEGKIKLFQIVSTETTHVDCIYITVHCECAGLELINKVFRKTKLTNCSLRKFMETILADTSWEVGFLSEIELSLDLDLEDASVYATLQGVLPKYSVEMEFRVEMEHGRITGKYIDVFFERGKVTGKRFEFGRDIESITRKIDSSETFTALVGKGNKGIDFREITIEGIDKPKGQDFVADQNAFDKYNNNGYHIMGLFQFETDSPEELLLQTHKQLQKSKDIKVEYEVSVAMLEQILEDRVHIGDTVTIIDNDFIPPIHLMARVTKLESSKSDRTKGTCTLANFKEVASNITDAMRRIASELQGYVDNSISSKFPIGGEDIKDKAISGNHIVRDSITTQHLKAELVESIQGKFKELESENAKFKNMIVEKASIEELDVQVARIKELTSDLATISTLVNGHLTSENIQAGGITSDKLTIADGFITNAMVQNLSADKINSGKISTNDIEIGSADGGIKIVGNTQQFKDKNGKVRVQIGQDEQGNFNFAVFNEEGTGVLIDATGIKEGALADGIIKTKMIGDKAITGNKIDFESFAKSYNESSGETLLKASKIKLDADNQTLDVSFNRMSSKLDRMNVGAINLLKDSAKERTGVNEYLGVPVYDILKKLEGKEVTISLDIKCPNKCKMKLYTLGRYSIGTKEVEVGEEYTRHFITGVVGDNDKNMNTCDFSIYGTYETGNIPTVQNIMITEGNVNVSYAPSPELLEDKITTVSTKVQVVEGQIANAIKESTITKGAVETLEDKYTKVNQTMDNIKETVAQQTTNLTDQEKKILNTESKINEVEKTATETKQKLLDAVTKSDEIKEEVNQKLVEVNASVNGVNTKVEHMDLETKKLNSSLEEYDKRLASAEQKITKDAIINTVEGTVRKEIRDVHIGGENLLSNADFSINWHNKDLTWDKSTNGDYVVQDWYLYNQGIQSPTHGNHVHLNTDKFGMPVMVFHNTGNDLWEGKRWLGMIQSIRRIRSPFRAGMKYTISMEIYMNSSTQKITGGLYYKNKHDGKDAFYSGLFCFQAKPDEVNKWVKRSWTFEMNECVKEDEDGVTLYVYGHEGDWGWGFVRNPKLEEGEIATAFNINSCDIQSKLTANINGYKAEQKIQMDKITASVGNCATKSEVTQTANKWEARFKNTVFNNIITNGRPTKTTNCWGATYDSSCNSSEVLLATDGGENWNGEYFMSGIWFNTHKTKDTWCGIFNNSISGHRFNLEKNYRITFPLYLEDNRNVRVTFRISRRDSQIVVYQKSFNISHGYMLFDEIFKPIRVGDNPIIMILIDDIGYGRFYMPYMTLVQGEGTGGWIPNTNEVYNGCTTLDNAGIHVTFSDGSYAEMGHDGLNMMVNGMKHPYRALCLTGAVNNLSFNNGIFKHKIQLPNEFKGKRFEVLTTIVGWNFPSDGVPGTLASGTTGNFDYTNAIFELYLNAGRNRKDNVNVGYIVIA